jgi:hypothetical protein
MSNGNEAMVTEPKLLAAMGEDDMQRIMKMAGDTLTFSESNLYTFNPRISNVSTEFAAADPAFWTPQPTNMAEQKPAQKSNRARPSGKK